MRLAQIISVVMWQRYCMIDLKLMLPLCGKLFTIKIQMRTGYKIKGGIGKKMQGLGETTDWPYEK